VWEISISLGAEVGTANVNVLQIKSIDGGLPITHAVLTELPMREITREALRKEFVGIAPKAGIATAHRGRTHSDEELRLVADAYEKAMNLHIPVQQAVAQTFNVSRSTAAKRIMAARKRGLLGPRGPEGET
jgi:hypothetical protein